MNVRTSLIAVATLSLPAFAITADESAGDWTAGDPGLTSIGSLTIGPDGVLFAADPQAATVYALKFDATAQTIEATAPKGETREEEMGSLALEDIDATLAWSVGTNREAIRIHDLAVDQNGSAYLSFTRTGDGSNVSLLARLSPGMDIVILDWNDVKYQKLVLGNAPAKDDGQARRRRSKRTQSITDLEFHEGLLYIAGLSNEEFASNLHAVTFPFKDAGVGRSIEIYHAAHGAWETRAPVRTMVPIHVGGEPYLLCGYTCTPLVRVPIAKVADVPADKFVGTTVAELGNRNTPLDMVVYEKDGARYVLIANTSRGVMKVSTVGLEDPDGLTEPVEGGGTDGLAFETIEDLVNVTQLAGCGAKHAVILVEANGKTDLRTIDLP